jgi:hypothetical protein
VLDLIAELARQVLRRAVVLLVDHRSQLRECAPEISAIREHVGES